MKDKKKIYHRLLLGLFLLYLKTSPKYTYICVNIIHVVYNAMYSVMVASDEKLLCSLYFSLSP